MRVKLYLLLDFQTLSLKSWSFEKFIEKAHKYDASLIQYRDKINPQNIQKQNIQKLKSLTQIPIIINDNLDLVEFCDGVHLGQEDLDKISKDHKNAIILIRKKIKNKILGISTHNQEEIIEANSLNVDYIGLGAYRDTKTKDVTTILGDKISSLAFLSSFPVAAIGGVLIEDDIEGITYNVVGSAFYED